MIIFGGEISGAREIIIADSPSTKDGE